MNGHLMRTLTSLKTVEEFKQWSRKQLRTVFPHSAMICGLGSLHAGGVGLDNLVLVDCPVEHIESIRNRSGAVDTPILRRWLQTQEPVYFEVGDSWPDMPKVWLDSFKRHRLHNVLAHALYDHVRCVGTYHSIYGLPNRPVSDAVKNFRDLVPALHETLCRLIEGAQANSSLGAVLAGLSERERKIIHWLRLGRTNAQIADLVNLSENTVKHYLTDIFERAGVENRAQLVRSLAQLEGHNLSASGTRLL